MSLFIPPPGAMQFEITLVRHPDFMGMTNTAVWVSEATEVESSFCSCITGRRLLVESVPQPYRSLLEQRRSKSGRFTSVCNCVGRIIE